MNKPITKFCVVSASVLTLIATGGSNGGGGGSAGSGSTGGGSSAPKLVSCAAQNSDGELLCGHNIQTNATTGKIGFINNAGESQGNKKLFKLNDGKYELSDKNGMSGGVAKDSDSVLETNATTGNYDNVLVFTQSYTESGTKYDVTGVTGFVTPTKNIPSKGSLTLNGEAYASLGQGTKGTDFKAGKAKITADFDAGKVDLTMNGFSAFDKTTQTATKGDIDTISAKGMKIDGSGFSGGTITTSLAGKTVNLLGSGAKKSAAGHFYGSDSKKPDEAAGLVFLQGDKAILQGVFITD